MAESRYHTILKQQIEELARDSRKYQDIYVEKKIPIPHPNLKLIFHYKPEVHLITRMGKKVIFEILDDEIGDYNLILADVCQCLLLENVKAVIFISKNEEGDDLAYTLSKIVGSILEDKGFFKRHIPEVFTYIISYEEVYSGQSLDILKKYAKRDKW